MLVRYVIPIFAALMLSFAVYRVSGQTTKPPEVKPPIAPARTPFGYTVAGAGIVEPQTENISVGSPLPGVVSKVHVSVGRKVAAGTVLFELDDQALRAELETRSATVAERRAQLEKLKSMPRPEEVPIAEARLAEAQAMNAEQIDLFNRGQTLRDRKVITEEEFITRKHALGSMAAQLQRAEADLKLLKSGAWKPDLLVAEAALAAAQAQAHAIEVEIERLKVKALVEGTVLQVNVRPGEFVGAPPGQALVVLGDVDRLHIRVDLDEYDIPRFRPELSAVASLRGHAEIRFPIEFYRIDPYVIPKRSLTGDNTERVDTRVLQVLYRMQRELPIRLYVGQQVDVFLGDGVAESSKSSAGTVSAAPSTAAATSR